MSFYHDLWHSISSSLSQTLCGNENSTNVAALFETRPVCVCFVATLTAVLSVRSDVPIQLQLLLIDLLQLRE